MDNYFLDDMIFEIDDRRKELGLTCVTPWGAFEKKRYIYPCWWTVDNCSGVVNDGTKNYVIIKHMLRIEIIFDIFPIKDNILLLHIQIK